MVEKTSLSLVQRAFSCKQRLLDQPDGSALFTQGRTSVLAAVYGPVEVRASRERSDCATLEVIFKPKVGTPGCSARAIESLLRGTCESAILLAHHPRSQFTIVVQELHDDGALLACCVNAVCAALLDACVPMRFSFASSSCLLSKETQLILDPKTSESVESIAAATFVFDDRDQLVIGSEMAGHLTDIEYHNCLSACRQASVKIHSYFRDIYAKKAGVL